LCGLSVTGVVTGLPAAGLHGRYDEFASRSFEQLDRCKADVRPHQVNQARDEQTDFHSKSSPQMRNGSRELHKTILTTGQTGKNHLTKIPVIPVFQDSYFSLRPLRLCGEV
jgi:hypothetical protein